MVSVGAGVADVEQWLVRWGDRLGVAAVNGVGSVVVSGEVGAVEELIAHCEGVGVWVRRIEVDYASHSVAVEAIEQSLSEALCGVRPGSSSVRFFSTVSGELMDTAGLDGRYWYRNIRERVQFGVPIGSFQAVQHRAADCYIDLEAMRWTTWRAVERVAEGLSATRECAVAKFWAAEGGARIAAAAQHLHGGIGVDLDYPIHRFFLRSKALELLLGGAMPQLARLGRDLAASGPVEPA